MVRWKITNLKRTIALWNVTFSFLLRKWSLGKDKKKKKEEKKEEKKSAPNLFKKTNPICPKVAAVDEKGLANFSYFTAKFSFDI